MRRHVALTLAVAAGLFFSACTPVTGDSAQERGGTGASPTGEPPTSAPAEPAPQPPLAWGPTPEQLTQATAEAADLTDEELTGTVIVARYEGTEPNAPATLVTDLHLGGVILFGPNVESLAQVQESSAAVQDAQAELGRDWPAMIAVDNEGGRVQRLSGHTGPWTTFPPFAAAGEASAQVVRTAMEAMSRELRASGVNTNYAPVADVTGAGDAAIGDRSASTDPEQVTRAVEASLGGFADGGVLAAIKHFPGHGGLSVDSHEALPRQAASADELDGRDLMPFRGGIDAGAPMVMMGHIDVAAWDEGSPASLSPAAYEYLREELGFTGVAITDGLDMGALEGTSGEIAARAMAAGADLLLTPADARGAREGLLAALDSGALERSRVEQAAGRVIALMRHHDQIAREAGPVTDADVGAAREAATELAKF